MNSPKEGELYKILNIDGAEFIIRYGYYCEAERERWGPTPIYPDFTLAPQWSKSGWRFVTAEQDVCPHYRPREKVSEEDWCNDCTYFHPGEEIIGICKCNECSNRYLEEVIK